MGQNPRYLTSGDVHQFTYAENCPSQFSDKKESGTNHFIEHLPGNILVIFSVKPFKPLERRATQLGNQKSQTKMLPCPTLTRLGKEVPDSQELTKINSEDQNWLHAEGEETLEENLRFSPQNSLPPSSLIQQQQK